MLSSLQRSKPIGSLLPRIQSTATIATRETLFTLQKPEYAAYVLVRTEPARVGSGRAVSIERATSAPLPAMPNERKSTGQY